MCPASGPVILASNHASFLDPPLVGAPLGREVNFLARESLFRFPAVGALLRSWNSVPVDRDGGGAAGLKAILGRLQAGGAILLFPEGTRSRDGSLQRARSGIGLAVIKSTAPSHSGEGLRHLRRARQGHEIPATPAHVIVKYGEPLDFLGLREEAWPVRPRAPQANLPGGRGRTHGGDRLAQARAGTSNSGWKESGAPAEASPYQKVSPRRDWGEAPAEPSASPRPRPKASARDHFLAPIWESDPWVNQLLAAAFVRALVMARVVAVLIVVLRIIVGIPAFEIDVVDDRAENVNAGVLHPAHGPVKARIPAESC